MMQLKPFDTIGQTARNAIDNMAGNGFPLSGYLAGKERGGYFVRKLEDQWERTFRVKHAIAVNSATSGLMAAAFAIGLGPGDRFACPAMTMSATAAAPMFTGATPVFMDVNDDTFDIIDNDLPYDAPVFATNLFGHPARLLKLRKWCDMNRTALIEDNSQSPFAQEGGLYAGTIGHIGVFSLNIHKPIQCGEGGVVVTDDALLASKMRAFINHGEHTTMRIGLNLRMPEICAAIALSQLQRGRDIIQGRIDQAHAIMTAIGPLPQVLFPVERKGCRNVYYTLPFQVEHRRREFCDVLHAEGVPIMEGYVEPLYRMPAFRKFARDCPVAERLHDSRLFYIENCAWDFTLEQCELIGAAFRKAAHSAL